MSVEVVTVEEFKMKVEELRLLIVEKLAELEEDAKWGTPDDGRRLPKRLMSW